jgi:hypothetical protein
MRQARPLQTTARLVLVWFALFVSATLVSPWLKSSEIHVVCSGLGAVKLVVEDDGNPQWQSSNGMDCPYCAVFTAVPLTQDLRFDIPSALAHALQPVVAAQLAWVTGSPLPPRGPPATA